MPLVLAVEDDPTVRAALSDALTSAGYAVRAVGTALECLHETTKSAPDLVILDLGLPDMDGAQALRMIRAVSRVPVIVATARRGELDTIRLLNAGADDYVTKPFSAAHLIARVGAVLRRTRAGDAPDPVATPAIEIGAMRLDPDTRQVTLDGSPLVLTRKEYDILAYLARRPQRVVTRRELFTEVWQQPFVGADQTLDVHLSWLRRKLGESAAQPRLLRTVRGVGVIFGPVDSA
ncbi:MAG: response regulator transcription factor [Hamadaea sp.]|uniref:response regulator transcription factor n=1 Tax=Hamadaea sp. TaxID=2024425 RepID=UPI0017DD1ABD|nr:response regulator transcription factor [Hamadaea sp.]NUT23164.1 response regulator transcription factor [Hamadaea sp.]